MLSLLSFVYSTPKTPMELAIDFILHDFEMAGYTAVRFLFFFLILILYVNIELGTGCVFFVEVEPISTYLDFGEREFLVADERGYECLLYKMAEDFLFTSEGKILDSRLKLNKVRRKKEKIYLFSFLNIDFLANYMFLNENFVCSDVDYPII